MKQLPALFLISFIFAALFLSVTISQNTFAKSAKDSKARRDINKAIGRATEGAFSSVKTVNISTYTAPNESITVYNKSSSGSLPPIIVPPAPEPTPPPVIPTSGFKLCMVGDFKDAKVFDAMKTNGCNYRVGIGDLGYGKNLDLVKSIKPDKVVCGNHDSAEDESATIEKECLAYSGNSWWVKFGSANLMLGFNTNGDLTKQLNAAKSLFNNSQFMTGVKNVIAVSHKGGHVFPNAHHPAEAKTFYADLEKAIPSGVKLLEISGHNHNDAAAPLKGWYIAGNGGKSFYACGNDKDWTYCNNKTVSYLEATIPDDGSNNNNNNIAIHFVDAAGKIIY